MWPCLQGTTILGGASPPGDPHSRSNLIPSPQWTATIESPSLLGAQTTSFTNSISQWMSEWKSFSRVQLFANSWTVQSLEFSRPEYWSGQAFPFSKGSSQPRDGTQVSRIAGRFFTSWATREAQEYWSGEPIPSPGDFLDPGIEPRSAL